MDTVVYNAKENELFVHHTVDLPYLPMTAICVAFEPRSCNKIPYIAIAGFATCIEMYHANCLDQIHPDFVLSPE